MNMMLRTCMAATMLLLPSVGLNAQDWPGDLTDEIAAAAAKAAKAAAQSSSRGVPTGPTLKGRRLKATFRAVARKKGAHSFPGFKYLASSFVCQDGVGRSMSTVQCVTTGFQWRDMADKACAGRCGKTGCGVKDVDLSDRCH